MQLPWTSQLGDSELRDRVGQAQVGLIDFMSKVEFCYILANHLANSYNSKKNNVKISHVIFLKTVSEKLQHDIYKNHTIPILGLWETVKT